MKKALLKNSIKEIKNTYKRFISLMLMAFLGVGFFVGIRAASPAMVDTIDTYYKDSKIYDIQVISTLGLTEADLNEIQKIDGVSEIQTTFETDGKIEIENTEPIVKIMCVEELNQPVLLEGTLPQAIDECVVEKSFLSATNKKIGDTIEVEVENSKNDDGEEIPYLNQKQLKIVGVVQSPLYISRDRGTTSLGTGKVDYYMYISKENVQANEIYTNIYVKVAGVEKYKTSSEKYEDVVEKVKSEIENIKEEREIARHDELVGKANSKIEEAENKLNTKKQNAEEEIKKAEQELQDGKDEIQKSENQINQNKEKVDKEFADAYNQIKSAKAQISSAEKELATKEKEANEKFDELNTQKQELSDNLEKTNQGITEAQKTYSQIDLENEQISEEEKVQLEQQKQKLEAQIKSLMQTKQELENGISQIETAISDGKKEINEAKASLTASKEELTKKENQYNSSKKQAYSKIEEAQAKIEKAKQEIETGEEELEKNKQEFEAKIKDAEKELIDAKSKVEDIENPKWYVLDRYGNSGYTSFIQDTQSIENLGKVFPIVFFVIAILISLTSMTRMVEEQRTGIGTIKALGYNKLQIASKYIIYASLASIIGGTLGCIVGFVSLPRIIWIMYEMMYQMRDIVLNFNWELAGLGLLLISGCIIGATIYAAMKELKDTPATLMRPKAPKMGKRVLLEKIPFIWKHLSFSQKVTVRNLFRYKKRVLMTIIGIFGSTSLILTGFGLKDSIEQIMPNQFEKVFDYDFQINLKNGLSEEQKQEYVLKLQEKTEIEKNVEVYMASMSVMNGENEEDVQIIVPKDAENLKGTMNIIDLETKQYAELKNDEICLTDKAAQLLGVKAGDTIILKDSDDNEKTVKISNIVENYVSHYVYMSKAMYENIYDESYSTNVILTKNKDLTEDEEDKIATELMNDNEVGTISRITRVMSMLDDTMKSLNYVVIVLIVSAGLLCFVVLYNLANVNISERIRELATLKVLGFFDKEVYSYVTRETVILTFIGILLGIGGGYLLNYFIMGTCEINILRFTKNIQPISYIYAILITIAFTLIVNIFTYFALKKIDMIESLKSVE